MHYYLIYKPYGMLSQFTPEQEGQSTLADLPFVFPAQVYPVGRLDADSEGLLLLTDDKALNARLLNPKQHFPKTYWAQVEGAPGEADLEKLRHGVDIKVKGTLYRTQTAQARLLPDIPSLPARIPPVRFRKTVPDSWIEITLTEGKNRQVRSMCAAVGFPVLRLVRVAIGAYRLGEGVLKEMAPGTVCALQRFKFEMVHGS